MIKDLSGKALFGSIIAAVLLGIYAYTLIEAICLAMTVPDPGETLPPLNAGVSRTMATVGGLVSALVIAELAITDPGKSLAARSIVRRSSSGTPGKSSTQWWLELLSALYVLAWILLGVWAFVVGELLHPDKVPALTNYAQAWLGLAVAAGYSYFGIRR